MTDRPGTKRLFWTLQFMGWGAYAFLNALSAFFAMNAPFDFNRLLLVACGFSLSLLLATAYRSFWRRTRDFLKISLLVVLACLLSAILWFAFCHFAIMGMDVPGFLRSMQQDWYRNSRLMLNFFFVLVAWSSLYFGIKYWSALRDEKEAGLRAKAIAREAQLQMLRYQLNPHFLFNSLNSIRALISVQNSRARDMITQLSELLRYSLSSSSSDLIDLSQEFNAIKMYLEIEKIRFDKKLQASFRVHEKMLDRLKIPSFLLHPIVENAVKYGMQTSAMPLQIDIQIEMCEEKIRIRISNSGHWVEGNSRNGRQPEGTGTGLQNVRRRLAEFAPNNSRIEIIRKADRVSVHLELPQLEKDATLAIREAKI